MGNKFFVQANAQANEQVMSLLMERGAIEGECLQREVECTDGKKRDLIPIPSSLIETIRQGVMGSRDMKVRFFVKSSSGARPAFLALGKRKKPKAVREMAKKLSDRNG